MIIRNEVVKPILLGIKDSFSIPGITLSVQLLSLSKMTLDGKINAVEHEYLAKKLVSQWDNA